MERKPLYLNPLTGLIEQAQPGDVLSTPVVAYTIYDDFATLLLTTQVNTCCALIDQNASIITSHGSTDPTFRPLPYVDCVILEAGNPGDSVVIADKVGKLYTTPIPLVYSSNGSGILYLGKDGMLTTVKPSLLNGDSYLTIVGRLKNATQFIFAPQVPIDLAATSADGGQGLPDSSNYPNTFLFTDGNNDYWKKIALSDLPTTPGILSFTSSVNILEVGQQLTTPNFEATYNENPTSISLRDSQYNTNNIISSVNSFSSPNTFSLAQPGSITFTLTANFTPSKSASTIVLWLDRFYYGVSSNFLGIESLQFNQLANSFDGSYNINAGLNEYIYFAIPHHSGVPRFSVNGLIGGIVYLESLDYTNIYGVVIQYDIYKSENHSLGDLSLLLL